MVQMLDNLRAFMFTIEFAQHSIPWRRGEEYPLKQYLTRPNFSWGFEPRWGWRVQQFNTSWSNVNLFTCIFCLLQTTLFCARTPASPHRWWCHPAEQEKKSSWWSSSKSECVPVCLSLSGRTFGEGCLFLYEAPPLPWPSTFCIRIKNRTQSRIRMQSFSEEVWRLDKFQNQKTSLNDPGQNFGSFPELSSKESKDAKAENSSFDFLLRKSSWEGVNDPFV